MNFAILKNEYSDSHLNWEKACNQLNVKSTIIDITKNDWLTNINKEQFDGYLACPAGRESLFKSLYDERIYILSKVLNKFVYPSYEEIIIHENKKFLSYWLKANNVPHPETKVFYYKKEAEDFIKTAKFPVVGKISIGASGKGVSVLKTKKEAESYIEQAFTSGLRQNWGPNLKMGGYGSRILKILKNPKRIKSRLNAYKTMYNEIQKGFIILQEYIQHDFEWRIVKIGESFFAHQKIKQGDKASGTKGINYKLPSEELLNFCNQICEKHNFNSIAIDLFEDTEKGPLINEMQCIFGHVQDYICEKNNKPGRLLLINNKWVFEEGLFNNNLSYNLRLENAINILRK